MHQDIEREPQEVLTGAVVVPGHDAAHRPNWRSYRQPAVQLKPAEVVYSEWDPSAPRITMPSVLPERDLLPRTTHDGRLNVGQGVLFTNAGKAVEPTDYMAKAALFPPILHRNGPSLKDQRIRFAYNAGWRNHYHTVIQGIFSAWLFENLFPDPSAKYLFPGPSARLTAFLNFVGLPADKVIYAHKNSALEFDEAVWLDTTYGSYVWQPSPLLREYGLDLLRRARVRDVSPSRIYISRRDSKNRIMENEELLEQSLAEKGFQIVQLSQLSLDKQAALFRSADVIVAPHGAGLAGLIFCRRGTRVIELTHSQYINPCFLAVALSLDLEYTIHISKKEPTSINRHAQDWQCDISSLPAF